MANCALAIIIGDSHKSRIRNFLYFAKNHFIFTSIKLTTNAMSKGQDKKKETKKEPLKSLKEKRAEKRAKKDSKG